MSDADDAHHRRLAAAFSRTQAAYDAMEPPEGDDDDCSECDGDGHRECSCHGDPGCHACGGSGEQRCGHCDGTGHVEDDDGDTTGWDPADDADEDPTPEDAL